jgi:hypothetical protein
VDVAPTVEVAWSREPGAEACIDAQELAERVGATLGRPVYWQALNAAGHVAQLQGEVRPLGSGWIAVVVAKTEGAAPLRREVALDAADCRQIDEALVLVVALMADAASPQAPRLRVPPPTAATTGVSIAIGPDVAFAVGMLPGLVPGVGFQSDAAFQSIWHVAVWAHAWPISEALEGGQGARLAAWTFGLGPCVGGSGRERVAAFACAGMSGGAVYTSGVGLDVPYTTARPYLQGELRAGIRLRAIGPLFARIEVGVAVPVARDWYTFAGPDGRAHEVFRTAPAIPIGGIGAEFRGP